MRPRKKITDATKLAATLRELAMTLRKEKDGELVPALTYRQAKNMTGKEIEALFHFDHNIQHALGGTDDHWNLTPRLVDDHRAKTAKVDVPQIAKTKRISAKEQAFRDKMLSKTGQADVDLDSTKEHKDSRKQKWPGGRRLQSRPFKRG